MPCPCSKAWTAFAADRCVPCPEWAECADANTTLATLALRPGWWRAGPRAKVAYACPADDDGATACAGGVADGVPLSLDADGGGVSGATAANGSAATQ